MTTRTLEATAVHTVTVAAEQSTEARTVAADVRDVFDAPTRVIDVLAELPAEMSPEASLEMERPDECATSTGERTKVWTRHNAKNASTAAFAATQILAVVPVGPVAQAPRVGSRMRASRVARIALGCLAATVAAALTRHGAVDFLARGGVEVAAPAAVVESPGDVEVPTAEEPTRVALSEQDRAVLETAAVEALLSGKSAVAVLRYRELATRDGAEIYSRVAKILEHAP